MSLRFRHAIVVGASSGLGAEIARQLAADGAAVALLARREDELRHVADGITKAGGRAIVRAHDVRHTDNLPTLLDDIVRGLGGLDCLVYAAGIMHLPREGEYDAARDRAELEVNLLGAMAWMTPVAAVFEAQRSGTIIGISSIAGVRGRKGNPMYGSSKAAMTHYLESLRNRLSERRVHVCTILPGYVDTIMTQGLKTFWLISSEDAARTILGAARRKVNERFVPWRWTLVALVLRLIPSFFFRRLNF